MAVKGNVKGACAVILLSAAVLSEAKSFSAESTRFEYNCSYQVKEPQTATCMRTQRSGFQATVMNLLISNPVPEQIIIRFSSDSSEGNKIKLERVSAENQEEVNYDADYDLGSDQMVWRKVSEDAKWKWGQRTTWTIPYPEEIEAWGQYVAGDSDEAETLLASVQNDMETAGGSNFFKSLANKLGNNHGIASRVMQIATEVFQPEIEALKQAHAKEIAALTKLYNEAKAMCNWCKKDNLQKVKDSLVTAGTNMVKNAETFKGKVTAEVVKEIETRVDRELENQLKNMNQRILKNTKKVKNQLKDQMKDQMQNDQEVDNKVNK